MTKRLKVVTAQGLDEAIRLQVLTHRQIVQDTRRKRCVSRSFGTETLYYDRLIASQTHALLSLFDLWRAARELS